MKILHLIQKKQLRGAEVFTSQLASHTNRAGHTAIIASVFPGSAELPFDGTIVELNGNPGKRFWDVKAWAKLSNHIKKEKPDIVQANAGDTLKYAVFSKLLFRWKQPIVFRNASTISLYIKSRVAQKWNSLFFRPVSKVISVSNASATDFAELFPRYKNNIRTIPIGIEHTELGHRTASSQVNHLRDKNPVGPLLIHVGGFTFEKNHKGLIDIFEIVLKNFPDASLHLVGDGPLKKQTEEIVMEKGLESNIRFYGFKKNALEYIRSADVLLLPSKIEGLPGVILEAFYCRIPVVAYDVGGIQEIVVDKVTGRLIKKNDEPAFAQAISDLLNDGSNNVEVVENAYQLVTTKYLNEQIASEFIDLYRSVITQP